VPVRSVPFTHKLLAKVEVAFVPVPFTSMNPANVLVPVPPTARLPLLEMESAAGELVAYASVEVPM